MQEQELPKEFADAIAEASTQIFRAGFFAGVRWLIGDERTSNWWPTINSAATERTKSFLRGEISPVGRDSKKG